MKNFHYIKLSLCPDVLFPMKNFRKANGKWKTFTARPLNRIIVEKQKFFYWSTNPVTMGLGFECIESFHF